MSSRTHACIMIIFLTHRVVKSNLLYTFEVTIKINNIILSVSDPLFT